MAGEYLYKITVETVRTPEGAGETPAPYSFKVATREDLVDSIDRTQAALLREAAQVPALIVGLKLLGGVAAQERGRSLAASVRQGLREFLQKAQALAS